VGGDLNNKAVEGFTVENNRDESPDLEVEDPISSK
jgi:hypothetical protein